MIELISSRFSTLFRFAFISIAVFMCLRVWLIVISWGEVSQEPIATVLSTLLVGMFYDTAFIIYLCTPIAILFTLIPERYEKSRMFNLLKNSIYIFLLFVLFITVAAELLFWDEFSARFNFISVDYLIYSHEVSQNILESYAVNKIVAIVLLVVIATYSLTNNHKIST